MKLLTTFSLCFFSSVHSSSGVEDAQFDRQSYAGRAKRHSHYGSSSTTSTSTGSDYSPANTGSSDSGQYNPVTSTGSTDSSGDAGSQGSPYSPSTGGSGDSSGSGSGAGSGSGSGSGSGDGSGDTATTASATGDPHFRINFANKDDICFDLSGTQGQVFNLLADPVSGLIVNAKIVDSSDHKAKNLNHILYEAHRLGEIGIISPEGNRLKITPAGIVGEGPVGSLAYNFNYDNDLTFGDIDFSINSRQRFKHVGASIRVDESEFEISVKEAKNALKFYIDAEAHAGNRELDGLLGFTFSHSYDVIDQSIIKMKGDYLKYDYDHIESCLRVKYEDLVDKLARHQLHEKYLLGAPPSMNMLEDLIPK